MKRFLVRYIITLQLIFEGEYEFLYAMRFHLIQAQHSKSAFKTMMCYGQKSPLGLQSAVYIYIATTIVSNFSPLSAYQWPSISSLISSLRMLTRKNPVAVIRIQFVFWGNFFPQQVIKIKWRACQISATTFMLLIWKNNNHNNNLHFLRS